MNEDNLPNRRPSEEGLKRDLAKVLTVGVGRPTRQQDGPIQDLELVAARLSDPLRPPLSQVEEVVRAAIEQFGPTGPFYERMSLLYGVHEDTQRVRTVTERRRLAAAASGDSIDTVQRAESQIHGALAEQLLKRYDEAVAQEADQTQVPVQSAAGDGSPQGQAADTSLDQQSPQRIEADEQALPPPSPEVTEEDQKPEPPLPARLRRRPQTAMGLVAVVIVGVVVALLAAGGGNSTAHHRAKTASLAVPVNVAPFAPNRPTFDYDIYDPNDTNCADPKNPATHFGRCGAETGHVLNSFINTPSYGDERYFFDARFGDALKNTNTDPLTGVKVGDTVVLRAYVDNDTGVDPSNPEASDTRNTRVRINLAATNADELASHEWVIQPKAFVSADNAHTVEDGVSLVGSEPFALQYEPGSAALLRGSDSYPLNNELVDGQGAPIGLLYMNGDLPAGNNFDAAALVELRAKVVAVAPPEVRITAQVRQSSRTETPWHSLIYVKPGDDVQWLLNTANGPWSTVYHVITRDVLPPNLELDKGSIIFTNARGHEPLAPAPLFGGGYDNGTYNPGDNTLTTFKTKVLSNFRGCEIIDRNQGFARSDQTPVEVTSDPDVVITKPGCSKSDSP